MPGLTHATILGATVVVALLLAAGPAAATPFIFFEGFDDDYFAAQNVPDLADASLSSNFSQLDQLITGQLTLRGPGVANTCSVAGCVFLDFVNGGGSILTLIFTTPVAAQAGSFIDFDVISFGSDGGELFKYVSNDGVNFTQVGDSSDAIGSYHFDLPAGSTDTYFRLQVGNQDIFDGIRVDNFQATIIPEPGTASLLGLGLVGLAAKRRRFFKKSTG